MKKTSILLPGLLLAASLFAWLQSGQVHLFANQGEWPVLLMLLGAVLLYQGKKEAAGPHVLIGMLLFGIGLHFFAKPELSWWPGDFEMILFVFGFSLFAAARKEYVYEAVAMIGFSLFFLDLFPIANDVFCRFNLDLAENMGMAPNQFLRDFFQAIGNCEEIFLLC